MACPTCGREAELQDRFCRSCGTPVVRALPSPPPQIPQRLAAPRAALQNTIGLAIVAFILLLALYFVTKSSTIFIACCVPVGFAFAVLVAAGLFGVLKKQPFRGDLL